MALSTDNERKGDIVSSEMDASSAEKRRELRERLLAVGQDDIPCIEKCSARDLLSEEQAKAKLRAALLGDEVVKITANGKTVWENDSGEDNEKQEIPVIVVPVGKLA